MNTLSITLDSGLNVNVALTYMHILYTWYICKYVFYISVYGSGGVYTHIASSTNFRHICHRLETEISTLIFKKQYWYL